jgi:hypothetical protein
VRREYSIQELEMYLFTVVFDCITGLLRFQGLRLKILRGKGG